MLFVYRNDFTSTLSVNCFVFVCRFEFSHEYDTVEEICKAILNQTAHRPTIGIICGTGLSSLGDIVDDKVCIPYEKIKHFPKSTGMNSYTNSRRKRLKNLEVSN